MDIRTIPDTMPAHVTPLMLYQLIDARIAELDILRTDPTATQQSQRHWEACIRCASGLKADIAALIETPPTPARPWWAQ